TFVFTPPDNGLYTVTLNAHDEDGGAAAAVTRFVTVGNVAPSLTLNPVAPVSENGIATLSGIIADPGTADSFVLAVTSGDPQAPNNAETYTFGPSATGSQNFTLTHRYLDDNPSGTPGDSYAIAVTVADDDGGAATAAASVSVSNVAPSSIVLNGGTVSENGTF